MNAHLDKLNESKNRHLFDSYPNRESFQIASLLQLLARFIFACHKPIRMLRLALPPECYVHLLSPRSDSLPQCSKRSSPRHRLIHTATGLGVIEEWSGVSCCGSREPDLPSAYLTSSLRRINPNFSTQVRTAT